MRRYKPKTRYKISKSQVELLLFVLKYRFVSSDLLADCLGKDRSTIYERLSVLVDQEYLVKLYDNTYRLPSRPATYYLAPRGIRYLKSIGQERTQLQYKNKTFSEEEIDEQFLLTQLARTIHKPYLDSFALYTKYQFGQEKFYLTPPPYARLESTKDTIPNYLIEYFPAYHESWKLRKRVNQHVDYSNEHDDTTYPYLLFVCGNENTERRVIRMIRSLINDFEIYTTTKTRLLSGETKIWLWTYDCDYDEEKEYISLPLAYEPW